MNFMNNDMVYDIAGIGIGPFNLGLAALCEPIAQLKTIFFEQKPEFGWHEGMMIPDTTLQVSYLADLVMLADPSSKFSYLNFLRKQNRLIQFGIHENNYITRSEYNRYCKWVCSQLQALVFDTTVIKIMFNENEDLFEIKCKCGNGKTSLYIARNIVIGVGTVPFVPRIIKKHLGERIIHSSQYLYQKDAISAAKNMMLIGSGQSAAEIFFDLINKNRRSHQHVSWVTRADQFFAMEHTKMAYEMATPGYIDYFFNLGCAERSLLLAKQSLLYKGVNYQLLNAIYDKLYQNFIEGLENYCTIQTNMQLMNATVQDETVELIFKHLWLNREVIKYTDFVIVATGYENRFTSFLNPIRRLLRVDKMKQFIANRNYSIDNNNRVFVQNAEMPTHGFNAPELGLGPYRNAVIINTILGYDYYPVDCNVAFQTFGVTSD